MRRWIGPVVGVLLLAVGVVGLVSAGRGLRSEQIHVDGVPVQLVRPATGGGAGPAVVVAHGYAGSGRLMRPFADTLARRGYVVALPDLAGHAANTRRFTDVGEAVRDIRTVVAYLRGRPDVDPDRVALLGHSMGASAVVRAGAADRRIPATVAISLGDDEAAALNPGPHNLMVVRGALEVGLRTVSERALTNTDHGEQVAAPLVEHVGVLFSDTTHRRAAGWIDDALGNRPATPAAEPHRRVVSGAATLVGLLLILIGGVALLGRREKAAGPGRGEGAEPAPPGRESAAEPGRRGTPDPVLPADRTAVVWLGSAVVAGPVVGLVLGVVGAWTLPAAVTGYLVGYIGGVGATLTAAAMVARGRPVVRLTPQWTVVGAGLAAAACAALLVPLHYGLTAMAPHGAARWLLLAALALVTALLLHGAHAVIRLPWTAAVLAIAGPPAAVAALIGLAPGFLLIISPLIAVLFLLYLALAAAVRRAGLPAWCAIPAGALMVAWPVATALPIT